MENNNFKSTSDNLQDLMGILGFVKEGTKSGNLPESISNEVKELWNQYKLSEVTADCTVICADFGILGSLVIRKIIEDPKEQQLLKYKSGDYDLISIVCNTRRILWTDYSDIEPYNRQSGLYCNGASFEMLGEPVKKEKYYREFDHISKHTDNTSFAVWGYDYNDFYGSIRFGICLKTELVEEFLSKLRKLIDK